MTVTERLVTIPLSAVQAALDALRADPANSAHVTVIERALNPPNVWVITCPQEDSDGYPTYLGRDQGALRFPRDGETPQFCFGPAHDAQLFSDADKDAFDAAAFAAEHAIVEVDENDEEYDEDAEVLRWLTEPDWELAASKDDALDAFSSGTTEIDFCEALSGLADRADTFRETL